MPILDAAPLDASVVDAGGVAVTESPMHDAQRALHDGESAQTPVTCPDRDAASGTTEPRRPDSRGIKHQREEPSAAEAGPSTTKAARTEVAKPSWPAGISAYPRFCSTPVSYPRSRTNLR